MNVSDAIKGRHSTRAFLNNPVPKSVIDAILDIARFAPSGVNTQPWHVIVLTGALKDTLGTAIIQARQQGIEPNPDYAYYPSAWYEPYKSRRKACGLALYSALGIQKEDTEKRQIAWYKNYYFFDAPVGLLFFIDKNLEKGSWLDMGMFIQNVMLTARDHGLDTCPQASMAEYPDIVRQFLMPTYVSNNEALVCGMALGFADNAHPVNRYRTPREPVTSFTQYID